MTLLRWRDWPLAAKLTVVMILLAALPLSVITLYNSSQARAEVLAGARAEGRQRALGTGAAIEAYLDERLGDIQALAAWPMLNDFLAGMPVDRLALEEALARIRQFYSYRAVCVLSVEGRVVMSTDGRLLGEDRITDPAFRAAAAGWVYAGEPYLSSRGETPAIDFGAPVRAADGRLLGVVTSHIDLDFIDRLVAEDTGFAGPGGYGMLWDSDGLILAHGRRPELRFTPLVPLPADVASRMIAKDRFGDRTEALLASASDDVSHSGRAVMDRSRALLYDRESDPFLRLRTAEGEWAHAVVVPLAEKRWLYGIFMPESNLLAVEEAERRNALIAAGLVGLGASILGLLLAREIAEPVRALTDAARAIAAGQLEQRIGPRGRDEVGQLASAFDVMAEALQRRTAELHDAQNELIRKERLAVLGQLAGAMAHELRNPLGAISNAAYFLNLVLDAPQPEVKEVLEILDKEVKRCARIISDLLDFARPKVPIPRGVNVNDIVREALSRAAVPENVEVVCRLDEMLPAIQADPGQLAQAFGNVILNGIQAMSPPYAEDKGGRLTVQTSEVFGRLPKSEATWIAVSFTDTGVGIPEENLGKLFEPLFTTKAKGIGLGLALAKMLVEGHGGTIEVESEVGKGSTFTVKLPVSQ